MAPFVYDQYSYDAAAYATMRVVRWVPQPLTEARERHWTTCSSRATPCAIPMPYDVYLRKTPEHVARSFKNRGNLHDTRRYLPAGGHSFVSRLYLPLPPQCGAPASDWPVVEDVERNAETTHERSTSRAAVWRLIKDLIGASNALTLVSKLIKTQNSRRSGCHVRNATPRVHATARFDGHQWNLPRVGCDVLSDRCGGHPVAKRMEEHDGRYDRELYPTSRNRHPLLTSLSAGVPHQRGIHDASHDVAILQVRKAHVSSRRHWI